MIKITYTPHIFANFYTRSCASIPQNKNSILFIAILSKLKGHGLVKKWTHEGPKLSKGKEKKFGHMKVQYVSRERLAHVQGNKREIVHDRSSYIIHKNSTHLHILIKVYDLFLLRIRSLT